MSHVVQIEFATGTKPFLHFEPEGFQTVEGYWFDEKDTCATIYKSPLMDNLVLSAFPDPPEIGIANLISHVRTKYPDATYILVLLQKLDEPTCKLCCGVVMAVDSLPISSSGLQIEDSTLPI